MRQKKRVKHKSTGMISRRPSSMSIENSRCSGPDTDAKLAELGSTTSPMVGPMFERQVRVAVKASVIGSPIKVAASVEQKVTRIYATRKLTTENEVMELISVPLNLGKITPCGCRLLNILHLSIR